MERHQDDWIYGALKVRKYAKEGSDSLDYNSFTKCCNKTKFPVSKPSVQPTDASH